MQSQKNNREEISSLYVLKALCAFGVVALHCPLGLATEAVQLIATITVPIFYMITGYFLYTPDRVKLQSRLSSSIKKVGIIIVITHTIYTLIGYQDIPTLSQWVVWAKWIFLGQHYGAGHLWYLTALIEALVVFYLCARYSKVKWIPYFILCFIAKFIFAEFRPLIFGKLPSMLSANALFYSFPFVSLGYTIRKYEPQLRLRASLSLILMLGSILATYAVKFLLGEGTLYYVLDPILRLMMTLSVFLYALEHKSLGVNTGLAYIGKELSGNIYYWHDLVIRAASIYLCTCVFDNWAALIVSIGSLLLAYIIVEAQKRLRVNYLP